MLITIDTLRSDHLGCYGYARATSPHLDALARQGLLFERATTTLPRTTQGVASILTGRYPKSHGARGLFMRLPETNLTLAEALKSAGYATAAAVSNTFLRPGQGFEQGFDVYDNPEGRWDGDSAAAVTESAVRLLDTLTAKHQPFFLWVHYLDPHWRYEPGPPWDTAFDPGFNEPLTVYADLDAHRFTKGKLIFDPPLDARQKDHVIALYDGEIARTDAALAPLLERLDRLPGPLLTAVTSDHGESLGEHGYHFAHGETLYEGSLRIPLLLRFPGRLEAGAKASVLAENIDIAPTILALVGVDRLQGVEGRPLVTAGTKNAGVMVPVAAGRPFVHAESDFQLIHPENPRYYIRGPRGRWTSASDGRFKLILIPTPGRELLELYDLAADPGESTNRIEDEAFADARRRLYLEVKRFADYGPGAMAPGTEEMSPEQEERLRSLGYIN